MKIQKLRWLAIALIALNIIPCLFVFVGVIFFNNYNFWEMYKLGLYCDAFGLIIILSAAAITVLLDYNDFL